MTDHRDLRVINGGRSRAAAIDEGSGWPWASILTIGTAVVIGLGLAAIFLEVLLLPVKS